jgi:flagellar biosynthesis chaperone FliJ
MTAKFQEKAQVAETEYTKALQELSRAQTRLKLLETQLREAEREREELQTQAQKHGEAHKNIDELYESLFAGPTPGFPEEDAREGAHLVARQEYERTSVRLVELRRALRLLFRAGDVIQRAGLSLGHAVRAVDASFFFVLSGADEEVRAFERYRANTQLLVEKALEISGDPRTAEVGERVLSAIRECVVDLGAVSSKQGLLMSVDHAGKRLNEAAVLLAELKTLTKEKEVTARNNFGWTARMLEDARQALQQIRQEAFEKVVGFGAAPPAYHECCDRASQLQAVGDDDAIDEAHSPLDEIWETSPVDPARESHTPPESLEMSSNLSSTARTPFHSIPVSSTVDIGMLGIPSPKIARG